MKDLIALSKGAKQTKNCLDCKRSLEMNHLEIELSDALRAPLMRQYCRPVVLMEALP